MPEGDIVPRICVPVIAVLAAGLFAAEKKPTLPAEAGDEILELTATAYADRQGVTTALGSDPGMDMIVVQVKLSPRGENQVQVSRDDFTLISRKDGQRSQPLAPSQIAGSGSLVVTSTGVGASGIGSGGQRNRPIWGGTPGVGDRPRRLGGDDDIATGATPAQAQATLENSQGKDSPLMDVLKEKILPEKTTNEAVSGQLYFFLEGKHKLKDLELLYKSPAGRLTLDFQK